MSLPPLLSGGRRAAFFLLIVLASLEAAMQVAMAAGLKMILTLDTPPALAAVLLGGGAVGLAAMMWARAVQSEAFGQSYANALRGVLAIHAVRAAGDSKVRLGTLNARMSGDLSALKNWADAGVCGFFAALAGLIGAFFAAHIAAGVHGVIAVSFGVFLTISALLGFAKPITRAIRARRQARGLVSARTGDIVLAANTYAAFGAERRARKRAERTGEALRQASVREARWKEALRLPVFLSVPLGVLFLAYAPQLSFLMEDGPRQWAGSLFALGLMASALSGAVKSAEAFLERQIGMDKIRTLTRDAGGARGRAPKGAKRLPPGAGVQLSIHDQVIADMGTITQVSRDAAASWLDDVKRGTASVAIDGQPACDVSATDYARRIAVVDPSLPLPRGPLNRMTAAKRPARPQDLKAALEIAALSPDDPRLEGCLSPQRIAEDPDLESRLRLTRALAHRPRALILNDPWITSNPILMTRIHAWANGSGVTLIVVSFEDTEKVTPLLRSVA